MTGREMYLYPPIVRFELVDGSIADPGAFTPYHKKPYIYQIHEFNNKQYLCVWEYDEENKRLIGRDKQSQPFVMPAAQPSRESVK